MISTTVTLSYDLKVWLDKYSKERNQSTAETIREALMEYKMRKSNDIFHLTSGLWKGRKQKYVREIRDEYSGR